MIYMFSCARSNRQGPMEAAAFRNFPTADEFLAAGVPGGNIKNLAQDYPGLVLTMAQVAATLENQPNAGFMSWMFGPYSISLIRLELVENTRGLIVDDLETPS